MLFLLKYQEKLSFFRIFRMFSQIRKIKEPVSTCSEVINIEEEQFGSELENRLLEKKSSFANIVSHTLKVSLSWKNKNISTDFHFFFAQVHMRIPVIYLFCQKNFFHKDASCEKIFFDSIGEQTSGTSRSSRNQDASVVPNFFFFFFCHVWNQVLVYLDKQVVEHFSLWWSTSVLQKHNFSWRNLFPRSFTQEK